MIRRNAARALVTALLLIGALSMTASADIRDITWKIVTIRGVAPPDATRTSFTLGADGRFAGTVGCNRLGGQATLDGNALKFGPVFGTRRACDAPLMQAEQRFSDALAEVRTWRQAGAGVELVDGSGAIVVALQR